jgi:hypothetical protein
MNVRVVDVGLIKPENIQQFVYGNNMANLFSLSDKIPAKQCVSLQEPLKGIWTSDALSDRFFSQGNVDYIQSQIQQRIYNRTMGKYTIDKQDCTALFVIMRGIFLQYSTNNNNNIDSQLHKLNENVLGYCVDNVYSELNMYVKYLYDASTIAEPLSTPILSNMKDKTLEFKNWFG